MNLSAHLDKVTEVFWRFWRDWHYELGWRLGPDMPAARLTPHMAEDWLVLDEQSRAWFRTQTAMVLHAIEQVVPRESEAKPTRVPRKASEIPPDVVEVGQLPADEATQFWNTMLPQMEAVGSVATAKPKRKRPPRKQPAEPVVASVIEAAPVAVIVDERQSSRPPRKAVEVDPEVALVRLHEALAAIAAHDLVLVHKRLKSAMARLGSEPAYSKARESIAVARKTVDVMAKGKEPKQSVKCIDAAVGRIELALRRPAQRTEAA